MYNLPELEYVLKVYKVRYSSSRSSGITVVQ